MIFCILYISKAAQFFFLLDFSAFDFYILFIFLLFLIIFFFKFFWGHLGTCAMTAFAMLPLSPAASASLTLRFWQRHLVGLSFFFFFALLCSAAYPFCGRCLQRCFVFIAPIYVCVCECVCV